MWKHLRKDRNGFSPASMVGAVIGVLITIVIALALVATVKSSVGGVNSTASWAAASPVPGILNLIPLLFILGVAIACCAVVFVALRLGMGGGA